MNIEQALAKIEALERRVTELERRPVFVPVVTAPTYRNLDPGFYQNPGWQTPAYNPPWHITCQGNY